MNLSVRKFVEIIASVHQEGPILEAGSMRVPGQEALDLRSFFSDLPYYGYDLSPGLGVDVVADAIRPSFAIGTFGTVLMCEMLEHCIQPSAAVDNARMLLSRNGVLIVTVPFCHPIHHLPDYWRFTPLGLETILERTGFHYRAVYFRGDLQLPSGLFSFSTQDEETFKRIEAELDLRLGEMPPGRDETSMLYRWTGIRDYLTLWKQLNPQRIVEMAKFCNN